MFALCIVFVYQLLSAQYESCVLPFAVLLSLPVGLTGVCVFAKIFGIDNNIYLQILVIMFIGLLIGGFANIFSASRWPYCS